MGGANLKYVVSVFLWFPLPIWYRVEKLSIEIAWSVFFLCLTMALFSLPVRKTDLCCNLLAKLSLSPIYCKLHEYTTCCMNSILRVDF